MQPHRQIDGGHPLEQRQVLGRVERLAVDVGEELDAAHALADVLESRRDRHHAVEVRPRIDVLEDVGFPHGR
jgi:hypothetical protein